jgi:hypothetical protein
MVAAGLAACRSPADPGSRFAFVGTLTEAAPTQSRLIAGGTITVQNGPKAGTTATAGADGRFTISGLSGDTDLVARATGYEDAAVRVAAAGGDVTRSIGLKPTMVSITETIGSFFAPRQPAKSFFRDVHHDGYIVVSNLYFYFTPGTPATRTVEVWDGDRMLGSGTINQQQYSETDLLLRVPGGARYEIRIVGGDWAMVKIVSPN